MALADILKKIIAESDTQIDAIKADFETQKAQATADLKKEEKTALAEVEAKKKVALEQVDRKTKSMARRENKNALAAVKRELLDQAMEAFIKSLDEADTTLKEALFTALVRNLEAEGEVVCAEADKALLTKLVPKGCTVKADKSVVSGFIYTQGSVTVNNTFANLIGSELKQEMETYFIDQLKLA